MLSRFVFFKFLFFLNWGYSINPARIGTLHRLKGISIMAISNWTKWLYSCSTSARKPIRRVSKEIFRPRIESLENRVAPAVDLVLIAEKIDSFLLRVETKLNNIDNVANKIPIIDKAFRDIPEVKEKIGEVRAALKNAVKTADPAKLGQTIKQTIFTGIGPRSNLNILGDTNDNGVDLDDINFTQLDGDAFTIQLDLHKSFSVGTKQKFGLGLSGMPFEVSGDPSVQLEIDLSYQDLTFGWRNDAPFFTADTPNELQIGLGATVTGEITGIIGFLQFTAEPNAPVDNGHHLDLIYSMDITNEMTLVNPKINGSADVTLNLKAEFDEKFPSIHAELNLQWEFANANASAGAGTFGNEPILALNHVSVGLGSMLSGMLGPVIDVLQPILAPLQPIIDVLEAEIPVLSDLSEAVGGPQLALLDIVELVNSLGIIPPGYSQLVTLTTDVLIPLANLIDDIDTDGDDLMIDFGDFKIKDLAKGKDLRLLNTLNGGGTLSQRIGDLSIKSLQSDFSGLVGAANKSFESAIDNMPSDFGIKDALKDQLRRMQNGFGFSFPLLDNPAQGVMSILLGNDVDLFTFQAQAFFGTPVEKPVGSVPFPIGLTASLGFLGNIDASFSMGYDTKGLRSFIRSENAGDLLDGFWIGADSHFDVNVLLGAYVGISVVVFSAHVSGGLYGNLHIGLEPGDADGKVHIRSELNSNLFVATGSLSLGFSAHVNIGVNIPFIGFVGHKETFDIASIELVSFAIGGGAGSVDNPFKPNAPVQLAGDIRNQPLGGTRLAYPNDQNKTNDFFLNPNANGILRLNIGARAVNRQLDIAANNFDIAENYVINHVDPGSVEIPPGAPAGEIISVSAFGFTERYYGVKEIRADLGMGNDSIRVNEGVTANLVINGQDGHDKITSDGSGNCTFTGGLGNDTLIGGTGNVNTLNGDGGSDNLKGNSQVTNTLNGGADDDVLEGGLGRNALFGEGGNDRLTSMGLLANVLDGGSGNDLINTGLGDDLVLGGEGEDKINWQMGNGSAWIDGGPGIDAVGLQGSEDKDRFRLSPAVGLANFEFQINGSTPLVPQTPLLFRMVEDIAISGNKGEDEIIIGAIGSPSIMSLKKIGINIGDIISLDGVKDKITVEGTPLVDTLEISLNDAVELYDPNPIENYGTPGHERVQGGVTVIKGLQSTVNGLPPRPYTIYAVNFLDQLDVFTYGGNDMVTIKGISGPTMIHTGAGNDAIFVTATRTNQFLANLVINGDVGINSLNFSDTVGVQNGIQVNVHRNDIISTNVPLGVSFSWLGLGHSIVVKTANNNDTIYVKSTNQVSTTRVYTFGGEDRVIVGDFENGAAIRGSALAGILGALVIDAGTHFNDIIIDDSTATVGHGNVLVNANTVLNFAPATIQFSSTNGVTNLSLTGSNSVNLVENYRISAPIAIVSLNTLAGNDTIRLDGVADRITIMGGAGNDTFQFINAVISAPVMITGDEGTDLILMNDQGSLAAKIYAFTANTLVRAGGTISFSTFERIDVTATNFTDTVTVMALPLPTINFNAAGGAGDILTGPNGANSWILNGATNGTLNGRFQFSNFKSLVGGTVADVFYPSPAAVFLGTVFGEAGVDTLNYSRFVNGVTVNLSTALVSFIGVEARGFENVVGGMGNDTLLGNNSANRLEGGNGNDFLLGMEGNDNLYGGTGRDILIGGNGIDLLEGGDGEDILIGGRTIYDANIPLVLKVMTEWQRLDFGYLVRIANLRNGSGLNGPNVKLNGQNVVSDGVADTISGGGDLDWFWQNTIAGHGLDILLDRQFSIKPPINELVN